MKSAPLSLKFWAIAHIMSMITSILNQVKYWLCGYCDIH